MSARGPFQDKAGIRVDALTIARGGRMLVRDLSFTVESGGYAELHGANGSGKTSLLRALAGFLRPRAGAIVYENIGEPALALHYVGHANGVKRDVSVRAHLRYWAGLFGAAPSEQFVGQILGLERVLDAPARILSQGQARRLALARLIIAPRPIWLLDEPAAALDESGRAVLNELVASQRANGGVVVAAVHESLGPEPTQSIRIGA